MPAAIRLAAYWWEADGLHRSVVEMPYDGRPPIRASDAGQLIGGPTELALLAREIGAGPRPGDVKDATDTSKFIRELCE